MTPTSSRPAGSQASRTPLLRLLLVDDTPTVRYLLRFAFEASSAFEVVAEAGDGQEAVDCAEKYRPDVVLLDLAMPVMDGLQAIPLIRERSPETVIIVHSGFDAGRMEGQALALGAAAYLEKSHRPDVLVNRVLAVVRPASAPLRITTVDGSPAPLSGSSAAPPSPSSAPARYAEIDRIRLCQSLAETIGAAPDLHHALGAVLTRLGELTGWPCGQAWVPDPGLGRLVVTDHWHCAPSGEGSEPDAAGRYEAFRADSARRSFVRGLGLPGHVWSTGQAARIEDVTAESSFPRVVTATAAGLRAAAAVPVVARDRTIAVLEFFGPAAGPDDLERLALVADVARAVGPFIQHKQAEDALRASEQRHRAVTEVAPEAIIGADGEGHIVAWNPGAERIFGYEAHEILGRPLSLLMPERYRAAHRSGFEHHRLGGDDRVVGSTVEVAGLRRDGTEFPVELSLGVWRSGGESFYSGIIRDISERKRAEAAVAAARDEAMHAGLQKSRFLATISHEIRTPLNNVLAMTSLLAGTARDAEQADWIRTAHRSALAAQQIINDILDFSKVEAGHMIIEHQPFDLREVVDDATAMVMVEARRKGLGLSAEIDPGLPGTCIGDAGRLRQVLINLLANAVRFTDSGVVTVRLQAPYGAGEVFKARVEVADTGIGISTALQAGLFEPFTQPLSAEGRRPGGTGLGLAICRQIITMMGGEIGVDSLPGDGSTFWCEFNLRTAEPPPVAPYAVPGVDGLTQPAEITPVLLPPDGDTRADDHGPRATVLVVEDDETSQKVAAVLLRRLGFAVEVASRGDEALTRLAQTNFDTVLMDCYMPGLDGFATTTRIRELEAAQGAPRRRIPVVAMTGAAMPGDRERCLAAGMDDYVVKPVTPEELERVVTRWVEAEAGGRTPRRPSGSAGENGLGDIPTIDWGRLDLLRQACSADSRPGVLGELVGEYLVATGERIDLLRAAVALGERPEVERLAHMLKGSSATFGATEVAGLAADLEQAAHMGSLGAAPEFLAGLAEAFDRAARSLRRSLQTRA